MRSVVRPAISDFTEVELFSALSRKARQGELRRGDAARVAAEFRMHLESHLYRRIALERRHFDLAGDWMTGFAVALRPVDALHLAVAATECLGLATVDRALARAAKSLGVRTA